jgi:hypothetical protein
LDFTYDPFVAAFFSALLRRGAEGAFESPKMAVWAVNLAFIDTAWRYRERRGITVVKVPTYQNPFLRAQDAFFILDSQVTAAAVWPPRSIDAALSLDAE